MFPLLEGSSGEEETSLAKIWAFFVCQLVLIFLLKRQVERFDYISQFLPGATVAMVVGLVSQMALRVMGQGTTILQWSDDFFMLFLLPPIIFNSGYHLKRKIFFARFGNITTLAVAGTIVSMFTIAVLLHLLVTQLLPTRNVGFFELVAFGALISSTDPVSTLAVFQRMKADTNLFYQILGESLLNDAVALTAFRAACWNIESNESDNIGEDLLRHTISFVCSFVVSIMLGYSFGVMSAVLFRHKQKRSDACNDTALFLCCILLPYWAAEIFGLSGIVAVLFSGISSRRYVKKNISPEAAKLSSSVFTIAAEMSEIAIFLMLGLCIPSSVAHIPAKWAVAVVVICTLARALAVYPLLGLSNLISFCIAKNRQDSTYGAGVKSTEGRSLNDTAAVSEPSTVPLSQIPLSHMHMIFLSGLRGAVSFACASTFPNKHGNRDFFIETTTFVILVTLVIQGTFTESAVKCLGIATGVDENLLYKKMAQARLGYLASPTQTTSDLFKVSTPAILDGRDPGDVVQQQNAEAEATVVNAVTLPGTLDWEARILYPIVLSAEAASRLGLIRTASFPSSGSFLRIDALMASSMRYDFEAQLDTSGGGAAHNAGSVTNSNAGSPASRAASPSQREDSRGCLTTHEENVSTSDSEKY